MYLFFDTETNGLPLDWKAPVSKLNAWPRLVQVAWLVYDKEGNRLAAENFIIRPEGFKIPNEASSIHGITTARAHQEGEDLLKVLLHLQNDISKAETLVAHNMSFDEKIVGAEFLRKKMHNIIMDKNSICTMLASVNFVAIPSQYSSNSYKWPKLSELHKKLFGKDFQEAHNASADIEATARCFWEMKSRGII